VPDNTGSFEEREDMQACLTVSRRLVSKLPFAKAGRFLKTSVKGSTP
jgi:hypothetical protein